MVFHRAKARRRENRVKMTRTLWLFLLCSLAQAQDPIKGILKLFETYRIVMFGEIHACRQEYDLLQKLVSAPEFADRVNDIVMEFGNGRYQDVVDRYISGENVPLEQVQGAWRDTVGAVGPVSPIYGDFYATVRAANLKLPKDRRIRVLLGDPPVDWSSVHTREDLAFSLPFRDQFYASVVRYQVLAKRRRALLIMGSFHFRRSSGRPGSIENELLTAFVQPYVIIAGSDITHANDNLKPRFDALDAPTLIETKGSWLGALPAMGTGGSASTWEQTTDAYLYLGPRDRLTVVNNRRSDLENTAYGNEVRRRLEIMFGEAPEFLPKSDDTDQPAFAPPSQPRTQPPPLPPLPKPKP
jgi:hypothetical protein